MALNSTYIWTREKQGNGYLSIYRRLSCRSNISWKVTHALEMRGQESSMKNLITWILN